MNPLPVHEGLQGGQGLAERKAWLKNEIVNLLIARMQVQRTTRKQVCLLDAPADRCLSDVVREYRGPTVVLDFQMRRLKFLVEDAQSNASLLPGIGGHSVRNHGHATNLFPGKLLTKEDSATFGNDPYCGGRFIITSVWLRGRLAFCRWFLKERKTIC